MFPECYLLSRLLFGKQIPLRENKLGRNFLRPLGIDKVNLVISRVTVAADSKTGSTLHLTPCGIQGNGKRSLGWHVAAGEIEHKLLCLGHQQSLEKEPPAFE